MTATLEGARHHRRSSRSAISGCTRTWARPTVSSRRWCRRTARCWSRSEGRSADEAAARAHGPGGAERTNGASSRARSRCRFLTRRLAHRDGHGRRGADLRGLDERRRAGRAIADLHDAPGRRGPRRQAAGASQRHCCRRPDPPAGRAHQTRADPGSLSGTTHRLSRELLAPRARVRRWRRLPVRPGPAGRGRRRVRGGVFELDRQSAALLSRKTPASHSPGTPVQEGAAADIKLGGLRISTGARRPGRGPKIAIRRRTSSTIPA